MSEAHRRMLATYRGAISPTTVDRDRVARAIAIAEGRTHAPTLRRAVVFAVIAAAATLVLAIAWSTLRNDAVLGRAAPDKTEAAHASGTRSQHTIDESPAAIATVPATLPTIEATPVPTTTQPRLQRPTAPSPPSTPAAPPEAELVRRIVRALDRRDFDEVLRLAAEHEASFASGTLAPEARALRILALCELGRDRQGRGEATLFLQNHPETPYRGRIERACELGTPR